MTIRKFEIDDRDRSIDRDIDRNRSIDRDRCIERYRYRDGVVVCCLPGIYLSNYLSI
jgi:hypothetical protein